MAPKVPATVKDSTPDGDNACALHLRRLPHRAYPERSYRRRDLALPRCGTTGSCSRRAIARTSFWTLWPGFARGSGPRPGGRDRENSARIRRPAAPAGPPHQPGLPANILPRRAARPGFSADDESLGCGTRQSGGSLVRSGTRPSAVPAVAG